MENTAEITKNIIETINTIFKNLFASIDSNLYDVLDNIVFVNKDILTDTYFSKIFGLSSTNGILLVANSLLIGFLLYYSARYMLSNFTYSKIENPVQFVFKCIIFGIAMNSSFFIIEQVLNLNFGVCELIRSIGQDLFGKEVCFNELLNEINQNLAMNTENIDIFTIDGLIKGTVTVSFMNLVLSYSLRYVIIKVLILLAPFAFLSLILENTAHFFKSWYRSLFSLLFIQIIVAIVLLLLFSMDYTKANLLNKFIYIGGIYALIRANSMVKELFGGISTSVQSGVSRLKFGGGK